MPKPSGLLAAALAVRKGEKKPDEFPVEIRKQVERLAQAIDPDAYLDVPRPARPFGRPPRIHNVRS